jgi:hypothetical protein
MSTPEQVLQQRLLLRFGSLPDLRIWRSNTGVAWQPITPAARKAFVDLRQRMAGGFRPVTYGVEGQTDIMGVLAPRGRAVGIEVKAEDGRTSPAQDRWRDMIVKHGGIYVLAKGATAEEAVAQALDEARRG